MPWAAGMGWRSPGSGRCGKEQQQQMTGETEGEKGGRRNAGRRDGEKKESLENQGGLKKIRRRGKETELFKVERTARKED